MNFAVLELIGFLYCACILSRGHLQLLLFYKRFESRLITALKEAFLLSLRDSPFSGYPLFFCILNNLPACLNSANVLEAVSAAGINKGDFNLIVGVTDRDICGDSGGQHGGGGFWIETTQPTNFSHEFGHTYGLTEEYSSKIAGGCYNDPVDINFLDINPLDPEEGCDPIGECCGECSRECEPCCRGNLTRDRNGRCSMSTGNTSSFGYCNYCYNQLTDPPDRRTADNTEGTLALQCGQKNPIGPQNIGEMTFMLSEDGGVNYFSMETYMGRPSFGSSYSEGPFRIEIEKLEELIFATGIEPKHYSCYGSDCIHEGQPRFIYLKEILPSGVTASDLLTVSIFKDGVATSKPPVNGQAPIADAGQDLVVGCTESGQATVTLDASASNDPDGDILKYTWSTPGITFNDTTSPTPTAVFPFGTTTVKLTVNDGIFASSKTVTVEVQDTTPPNIACPQDLEIECNQSTEPGNTGSATTSDTCRAIKEINYSDVETPGECTQEKIITRTWIANDALSNISSCTQTINVVDTMPAVVVKPNNVTIECDDSIEPSNTGSATASDNCDSSPTVTYSDVVAAGSCSAENTITRTWTATDNCGNNSSDDQTINVVDTTLPVISCNAPPTMTPPDVPISFTATASDNCDDSPFVVIAEYDCYKYTKKGKRIDKTESCVVETVGDQITILDSGGVDDHIEWKVEATDDCGNISTRQCEVLVVNPAK